MEWSLAVTIWSGICLAVALILVVRFKQRRHLPPGPPGWPLVGNIFDLGAEPHKSLTNLSHKYGPVICLKLGAVNTMVVSSAEASMEMFKNHDLSFAGRATNEAFRVHELDQGSMSLAQYGPYWRMLRRISTTELFTTSRIKGTESLRAKEIETMKRWVWDEAQEKGSVDVALFVALTAMNIIGNVTLSKDNIVDPKSDDEGAQLFDSFTQAGEWMGKPNLADFFPLLRWLDPQQVKKNCKRVIGYNLSFVRAFVKERIVERQKGELNTKKDFLDVMIEFKGNQKDGELATISEKKITILILELFAASTETTSSTIEWAIAELLRHPDTMRKLHAELDEVVGFGNKVEQGHVAELLYLRAVVKETLRLHPPVPFLVPRRVMQDTQFKGYTIPKGTNIFVNVWAIGRDPLSWDDPLSFKPERFISSSNDYKGQHFQFIPFGAGRRMCVGLMLADHMLHLTLGSLIHSFEWAPANGIIPEEIDMRERLGIALRMAKPLKVALKQRTNVSENLDEVAEETSKS